MALLSQQTRGIHPILFYCWASVEYAGPTLKQNWVNAFFLGGCGAAVAVVTLHSHYLDRRVFYRAFSIKRDDSLRGKEAAGRSAGK